MSFDIHDYEVGDTFDVGPIEGGRYISAILAAGGSFSIDGNTIVITHLDKPTKAATPAPVEKAVEPPPEPDPEPEPYTPNVVEEVLADSYDADSDTTLPVEEEAPPITKAEPIKRARKTKESPAAPAPADVVEE